MRLQKNRRSHDDNIFNILLLGLHAMHDIKNAMYIDKKELENFSLIYKRYFAEK